MADNLIIKIDGDAAGFEKELKAISNVGKAGLSALTASVAAVSGAMVYAASVGIDFESSLAKVNTIADTSAKSLQSISDEIIGLSSTTGVAATELTEALYQSISAGVDTAKSVDFVAQANKLAVGGFTDAASAVDVLTTVINAYGMSADDATNISDMLIQTQNKGKTTVADLASNMGRVIPTANSYGVSIDNLCSSYAIMTAKGIATAESTTYLNGMINELGKAGTTASTALKESTGKTFSALMAEGNSLADVLAVLQNKASESGLSMGDMFGSAEAGKAAMAIASSGVDEFNNMLNTMNNSAGATESAFETMQDTTETALAKMKNNLTNTGIAFFEKFKEPLKDGLLDASNSFDDLQREIKNGELGDAISDLGKVVSSIISGAVDFAKKALPKVIKTVSTLLKGLGKTIELVADNFELVAFTVGSVVLAMKGFTIVTTVTKAIKAVTTAQTLWNAAMLANPVGAVITVVAALAAGLGVLAGAIAASNNEMSDKQKRTEEAIKKEEEHIQKIKEKTEAYHELKSAAEEKAEADLAEVSNIERLNGELKNLVGENGEVQKSDETRVKYILGELSEAVGHEITLTDGVISNYKDLQAEIFKTIEAKKAQILLEEKLTSYADATKKYAKAQSDQAKQAVAVANAQAEVEAAENSLEKARNNAQYTIVHNEKRLKSASEDAINTAHNELKALKDELSEKQAAYDDNEKLLAEYYTDINAYETAQGLLIEGKTKEAIDYMNQRSTAWKNSASVAGKSAEEQKSILETQLIETTVIAESLAQKYADGVDGVTEQMVKDARNQAELAGQEFNAVGGKITESTTKAIIDASESAKVNAPTYEQAWQNVQNSGIAGFFRDISEYKKAGANIVSGLSEGIESSKPSFLTRIGRLIKAGIDAAKAGLDAHSPSRKFVKIGRTIPQGTAVGVKKDASLAVDAVGKLAEDMAKTEFSSEYTLRLSEAAQKYGRAALGAFNSMYTPSYAGVSGGTVQNTYNNYTTTEKATTVVENVVKLDGEVIYQNQRAVAEIHGDNLSKGW